MPIHLCGELYFHIKQAAYDDANERPALGCNTRMEVMGMSGLGNPSSTYHLIHLLSSQIVPGFAAFLWDSKPSPSS